MVTTNGASTYHFIDIEHERCITIHVCTSQIEAHQLHTLAFDIGYAYAKEKNS